MSDGGARAGRLGLRGAAAAAALRPPPPPPTARPALAAMPIPGDMLEFSKVLRRWSLQERAATGPDRHGAPFRAMCDMRDLWNWIYVTRDARLGG